MRGNGGIVGPKVTSNNIIATGVFNLIEQQVLYQANSFPGAGKYSFDISPSYNGKTFWDLSRDGNLTLNSVGVWNVTPRVTFTCSSEVWGSGGGRDTISVANGGGGGCATGDIAFQKNQTYTFFVGNPGQNNNTSRGASGGGAACGILIGTTNTSPAVIIGGGGGGAGNYLIVGGAGGGTNGQNAFSSTLQQGGRGGTQTAAGAGGIGDRRTGTAGSGTNGGRGAGGGAITANGGTSGITNQYSGGNGHLDSGDNGSGGGGGGYFGGGGGGGDGQGYGGGGGSGFANTQYVSNAVLYTGSNNKPGNISSIRRGNSGNTALPGAIVLYVT